MNVPRFTTSSRRSGSLTLVGQYAGGALLGGSSRCSLCSVSWLLTGPVVLSQQSVTLLAGLVVEAPSLRLGLGRGVLRWFL